MSYYEKVLQPGEEVLYNKRLHWIVYLKVFILTPFVVFFGFAVFSNPYPSERLFTFFVTVLVLWIAALIIAWISRMTTEVVVTNKRIILKRGLILRKTMEMNMNKVETVDVSQSILGRIFNYGTIVIRGVGSTYEPLRSIDTPIELRNTIIVR